MTVRYERSGPVTIVTIDRFERRNAIDRDTAVALGEAWRHFDQDPGAAVGILTGEGMFSAGADLKSFDLVDDPQGFLGFTRLRLSKPTIAAIEGHCVAGGLEMALWCDLRVAGDGAIFGCFERRLGVPLVDGGTQRLPRLVGLGRALDLILTGRPVLTDEALAIGLIDRRVASGTALTESVLLGDLIASFPQTAVRSDRRAVLDGLGLPMAAGLELERELGLPSIAAGAEGARRFADGEGRGGA
jgi:enoyl-CoA hydratase